MKIEENVILAPFTTFKIGGPARYFARLEKAEDAPELVKFGKVKNLPMFILGSGSNIIVSDEALNFLVVKNEILKKEIIKESDTETIISVGAGENWDGFVGFCVERGFIGVEALSAIPGTVGAAPIQNIGAYGQEVSNVIESVEVYDTNEECFKTLLSSEDCEFSYRDSIFKKNPGRYIVLSVTFRLKKNEKITVPDYPGMKEILTTPNPTLKDVREAIKKIRSIKLPDPTTIPNVGSFFKNPIVPVEVFERIKKEFPEVRSFEAVGGIKIPAGWLIEKTGLKGKNFDRVSTYGNNALVLVNDGEATFADVSKAEKAIKLAIREKFDIELEREPVIVA